MADRKYFVLCESNCKFESMTKEQIFSAITEATGNVCTGVDDAFITKLKEQNRGTGIKFWVGSQAEYNALVANESIEPNVIYCTSDGGYIMLLQKEIVALNNAYSETRDDHNARITALENTTVPISKGGTGATSQTAARANLGLGTLATLNVAPITNGGTGATGIIVARNNLGIATTRIPMEISKWSVGNVYSGTTTVTFTPSESVKSFFNGVSKTPQCHFFASLQYCGYGDDQFLSAICTIQQKSYNEADVTVYLETDSEYMTIPCEVSVLGIYDFDLSVGG